MRAYKKKMKLLVDSSESVDYLQRNGLFSIDFGECAIRTNEISEKLQRLSQLESDFPQMVEQELKQKITPLLEENRTLKAQLLEKTKPVEQYETEITRLQNEVETSSNANEELLKTIQKYEENINVLQEKTEDLEATIKELNKTGTDAEEINQIYDRIGTFKKIRNKLRITALWEGNPEKVLRQIEILHLLEGQMGVGSIKQYIKEMIRGKLLSRTSIQGSYVLNIPGYYDFKLDCDKLCELLLGSVYETGVQICMEKIKSEREPDY